MELDVELTGSDSDEPAEDDKTEEIHGHVNSISVLRSYRRLGLAKKLMLLSRTCPQYKVTSYASECYSVV